MEWYASLALLFVLLIGLLSAGVPVAIAFLASGVVGSLVTVGGWQALTLVPTSMMDDIGQFSIAAVALFILMGTILTESGYASKMLDGLDKWIGRIPGRMSYVVIVAAAGFGAISGSGMASTATLGANLAPEMHKRGYAPQMIAGPIVGAGGIAMIMPPSSMAVILGSVTGISIGQLLIAGILPAIAMAVGYAGLTAARVALQPHLVPADDGYVPPRVSDRLRTLPLIVPVGLIFTAVVGSILMGLATPTESAALGAIASFVVVAVARMLSWGIVRQIFVQSVRITANVLFILAGAAVFSRVVSLSGASRGLIEVITELGAPPAVVLALMIVVILILGMFMEQVAILLVTMPVFMPIVQTLGFDLVWFGIIVLICLQIGMETPPFGLGLYIAQNFMPWISTRQLITAVVPYILVDVVVVVLIAFVPALATWLPQLM
jgi:tripartite ATP-independent transporter DctM subunit